MEILHYNIDMTPESSWQIVSAGAFAKDNLLYLQEAGHFISGVNYYTVRKDLDSYLVKLTLAGQGILEYGGETYQLPSGRFSGSTAAIRSITIPIPLSDTGTFCGSISMVRRQAHTIRRFFSRRMARQQRRCRSIVRCLHRWGRYCRWQAQTVSLSAIWMLRRS